MPTNESDIRNAALEAEWKEPPLTCPHIDRAIESGTLPPEVVEELLAVRDINSQLRYGTWYLKARVADLEAEVTRYQQLLDAAIDDYNGARNAALEAAAKVAETGDWYGEHQTAGDERRAKAIASRIRALKSDAPPAPEPKPFTFKDPAAQLQHERLRTRKAEER